jgi:hypothetical protein
MRTNHECTQSSMPYQTSTCVVQGCAKINSNGQHSAAVQAAAQHAKTCARPQSACQKQTHMHWTWGTQVVRRNPSTGCFAPKPRNKTGAGTHSPKAAKVDTQKCEQLGLARTMCIYGAYTVFLVGISSKIRSIMAYV